MEFPAETPAAEAQTPDEQPMAIDTNTTPEQQLPAEQQLEAQPVEAHEGMQPDVQGDGGIMAVHMDAGFISAPAGLPPLQPPQDSAADEISKFKPIDLEQLSPKSRQRVLRNRQAATRSKAKKKQQFQTLKDKKSGLEAELQNLENQFAVAQQRIAHLQVENQGLMQSCKCPKE